MARKLVLCSTPSAKPFAKKVCNELNRLFRREFERLKGASPTTLESNALSTMSELKSLNEKVFGSAEFDLWPIDIVVFSSTEIKPIIRESVRGADVFLVHHSYEPQTAAEKVLAEIKRARTDAEKIAILNAFRKERSVPENDKIAEMLIDALKRDCMARRLILISPFFANSRQDHRRGREGLTSRTQIKAFEKCGVDAFLFIDLHSQSTAAISESHIDNIYPTRALIERFKQLFPDYKDEFVLISPDAGAAKRVQYIAKHFLNLPFAVSYKWRDYSTANVVDNLNITDPHLAEGKRPIIIDDMVDTAGSIKELIELLARTGAQGSAVIICSHALLSGPGVARLDELHKKNLIQKLITTDSVPRPPSFSKLHPWYCEVTLSPVIAETIYHLYMNEPVANVYLE